MATAFENLAPRVMADLIRDFGLTPTQAAGLVGNLGAESGLISGRQEGTSSASGPYPIRGYKGGIDWPQWTGSRRVAFADWVAANDNVAYPSYEASYGFMKHELETTHRHTIQQLKKTTTVQAAAETAEAHFEKAGIKNMGARVDYGNRALALYQASPYSKSQEVSLPNVIATPSRPAIPWWQSVVAVGSGAGLGTSLLAVLQVYRPGVSLLSQLDTLAPPLIAAGSALVALVARVGSHAQPLTMTTAKADEITAQRTAAAEALATPAQPSFPMQFDEAWNRHPPAPPPNPMLTMLVGLAETAMGVPKPMRDAIGVALPGVLAAIDALKQGEHQAAQQSSESAGPMPSRYNNS